MLAGECVGEMQEVDLLYTRVRLGGSSGWWYSCFVNVVYTRSRKRLTILFFRLSTAFMLVAEQRLKAVRRMYEANKVQAISKENVSIKLEEN